MSITLGKAYWVARVRPCTSRYDTAGKTRDAIITESDRVGAYDILEKLGVCGKGQKHRYLSDRQFKTEAAARKFFAPHVEKNPLLDKMLEYGEAYPLYF